MLNAISIMFGYFYIKCQDYRLKEDLKISKMAQSGDKMFNVRKM